jgi:hypothetical protein
VRQVAIAGRPTVSRDVADALSIDGCEMAVRTLASNDNADLSEQAMLRSIDRFGAYARSRRGPVLSSGPAAGRDRKLIALASDAVREHLISRHAVAPETAIRLATFARERSTIDLVDQAAASADLPRFVAQLNARKALTASLLLRALARGQMILFEHAVAELASTPHSRAWLMVHDAGPLGLKAIYDRAGLPPRLFQAFRAGVDTWRALQAEGADTSGEDFRQRMLERFLTQRPNAPRDDLAYLMERLDQPPLPARAGPRRRDPCRQTLKTPARPKRAFCFWRYRSARGASLLERSGLVTPGSAATSASRVSARMRPVGWSSVWIWSRTTALMASMWASSRRTGAEARLVGSSSSLHSEPARRVTSGY